MLRPTLVQNMQSRRVIAASCSYYHTAVVCASLPANNEFLQDERGEENPRVSVFTVGRNDSGQLGLGRASNELAFRPIKAPSPLSHVSRVACGLHHSLFVLSSGEVYSSGFNDNGQLGYSDVRSRLVPEHITALTHERAVDAACGYYHSLVLTRDGNVYAFGRNDKGQLGINSAVHSCTLPELIREFRFGYHTGPSSEAGGGGDLVVELRTRIKARKVACGCYHSLLLSRGHQVFSFGRGNHGQLGHGGSQDMRVPTRVQLLVSHKVIDMAAGFYHTVLLTSGEGAPLNSSMTYTANSPLDPALHYRSGLLQPQMGLSRDFARLFRGSEGSESGDVRITCGEKEFNAHRCILWARCRALDQLIDKHGEGGEESKHKESGKYQADIVTLDIQRALHLEGVLSVASPLVIQIFLLYLYSDKLEWGLEAANNDAARSPRAEGGQEGELAIDILRLALFFKLKKLKDLAEKRVLHVVDVSTVCRALNLVWGHGDLLEDLKEKCLAFAINHFGQLIAEPSFSSLPQHILREVLTFASSLGVKIEGKK